MAPRTRTDEIDHALNPHRGEEQRRADSFVDTPPSSALRHRSLVAPPRERDDAATEYAARIQAAARELDTR